MSGRAEDRPRDGEGRGRVPALRPVRRALPDRRVGHAEVPARHGARRRPLPRAATRRPTYRRPAARRGPSRRSDDHAMRRSPRARQRFRRQVRQRQRLGLGVGQRALRARRSCGWACRCPRATSSRRTSRACRRGTRCASTEAGWRGRRGGVDLMVAMNPQTWDKDVAEIDAGGYLFYDSTRPMPASQMREDVTVLGMPLTAICNAEYTDARQRQLFKNIIYLGALSALLDLDAAEVEKLFAEQYKGKEALLEVEPQGACTRPRLRAGEFRVPAADPGASARTRSATGSSSTATAPRRWAASTAARPSARGIRSRRRRRSPKRSRSTAASSASTPRPASTSTRSCRPRTSSRRSAW